jgi:uncharacterized protein (DUF2249 family)
MKISAKTKVSKLIDANEQTIDIISSVNKHFRKLKNPFLRKALAPRVTLSEAARIGGVPVCVLIDKLKEIGFELESDCGCETASPKDKYRIEDKTINMKKEKVIEMDVRPVLAGGVDPFEAIMAKLKTMADDETLMIINTFEPIPLLNILKKKGYDYETVRPENGVVHTYLEKVQGEVKETESKKEHFDEASFEQMEKRFEGKMTEVDVRDLEMPLPMVTILNEIEKIEPGHALYVHHKKLPQYLIPEMEDRGYKWVSDEIDDSNIKLIIFK